MLFREFPDHTRPDFNLDAPCPVWGWPNMIIHARSRSVSYPEHSGPLSIKCAFGGDEVYSIDSRPIIVNDRCFLILNQGSRYSSSIDSLEEVETFCIFFRSGFAAEVATAIGSRTESLLSDPEHHSIEPTFVERPYSHNPLLSPPLFAVRRELGLGRTTDGWLEEQFHTMMECLLRMHGGIREEMERITAVRSTTKIEIHRRLSDAREFIDANLGSQIDLSAMATVACLSPHHFLRLFKQAFQETPHQYLTRIRMERARELLTTTSNSITDICNQVGFESLGSFSWLFRRQIGLSPEKYRTKSHLQETK